MMLVRSWNFTLVFGIQGGCFRPWRLWTILLPICLWVRVLGNLSRGFVCELTYSLCSYSSGLSLSTCAWAEQRPRLHGRLLGCRVGLSVDFVLIMAITEFSLRSNFFYNNLMSFKSHKPDRAARYQLLARPIYSDINLASAYFLRSLYSAHVYANSEIRLFLFRVSKNQWLTIMFFPLGR